MQDHHEEQLEAMKRELARQDEEWERAKTALAALGDAPIQVHPATLQQIDDACAVRTDASPVPLGALRA